MTSSGPAQPTRERYSFGAAKMSDIRVGRPVRIGVIDGNEMRIDSAGEYLRVGGVDLRRVAQRSASARGDHPGIDVLVDIDVMIDHDAAGARDKMAAQHIVPRGDTLTYIGTPAGLAGLITDLHALGICDGAMLRPLLPHVAALIRGPVLHELDTMSSHRLTVQESRPA